jgi:hypothetical protein
MRVIKFMTLPLGAKATFSRIIGPASWPLPTVKPTYLKKQHEKKARRCIGVIVLMHPYLYIHKQGDLGAQ